MTEAVHVVVRGAVQGVGFRPFAWRLAHELALRGAIRNGSDGVLLDLEGPPDALACFRDRLVREAPEAARVDAVEVLAVPPRGRATLEIVASEDGGAGRVRVPPDLATCVACRDEVLSPSDRRSGHPFASCTACGPRYSIVRAMPYDRAATTMASFAACPACAHEYRTPGDRRFHAQPIACPACGPRAWLLDAAGEPQAGGDDALATAVAMLRAGRIVALQGLGGFQLLVRADDDAAVACLRTRKARPAKPLAVMVATPAEAERLGCLDAAERAVLASRAAPIVVVRRREPSPLAGGVAPGVRTVGLFLPTTPLHHLVLRALGTPVVATSGNRSAEPIAVEVREAVERLGGIADVFLVHDRPIARRLDDAVVRVIGGRPTTLRLGRGLAPQPLPALETLARGRPPALATGGHLKVAPALWTGTQALLAQHVGDMDDPDARHQLGAVAADLAALYGVAVARVACDLHPDYWTTRWAADRWLPTTPVQHHHAHAVSAMVEHGLLDREVLAVTWDGTGFGTDGTVWGGEILRVRPGRMRRVASLRRFPLPGGEAAIRRPERIAWALAGPDAELLGLPPRETHLLGAMVSRGLHTPLTSSVGRLFDAVAALVLGIRGVSYEGEAASRLEAAASPPLDAAYPLPGGDWRPMMECVVADVRRGRDAALVASALHGALARWAAAVAAEQRVGDVVLTGGCFQNALLAARVAEAIRATGARVYLHGAVPPNDGGLAAGQLAVALLGDA